MRTVEDISRGNEDADRRDIEACLEGDRQSYASLVRRYEKQVADLMWRFSRDRVVCEELVQDVFVEAWFNLHRYRGEAPFLHWLRGIGTRVGYQYWKRRSREKHVLSLSDFDEIRKPQDKAESSSAGEVMHTLLSRLPSVDRLVLTLMYFEDCSTREIAARMGWSRAMVKMRAHRARKKMKALAEKEKLLERLEWIR
jgi:RNA polymerase sigma-70 factor (ECF subfamily)